MKRKHDVGHERVSRLLRPSFEMNRNGPPGNGTLARLQHTAGNRAVAGFLERMRQAESADDGSRRVVQRQIDETRLPGAVLAEPAAVDQLREYLSAPVNSHETFTQAVESTIAELPAEAEKARVDVLWGNVRYFARYPEPLEDRDLDLFRRYLVSLAAEVNKVHTEVREEIKSIIGEKGGAGGLGKALQAVLAVPPAARSLLLDPVLWSNLQYFLSRADAPDAHELALSRRYATTLVSGVERLQPLLEKQTRMGLEMETGDHFIVSSGYRRIAESAVNVTLARTGEVEFLIDDIRETDDGGGKKVIVQIEFRTRPFTRKELSGAGIRGLKHKCDEAIKNFPVQSFGPGKDIMAALQTAGWRGTPALRRLAPGMRLQSLAKNLKPKPIQHVTHSIPVASFVKLPGADRNLLIPGSGSARSVEGLLDFFLTKKIVPQSAGGAIKVTTKGRNKYTPNVKSALDTIIGFLPDERFAALMAKNSFQNAPTTVTIEGSTGRIEPPTVHEGLPSYPSFSVHEGKAHLSAEEKLKPVLFDPRAKDIRVLVEHRGDALVAAVNQAAAGNTSGLKRYLDVLGKLDQLSGEETFGRWFS